MTEEPEAYLGAKPAQCRTCGRKIYWGTTPAGKRIPLDAVAPVYRLDGTAAMRAEGHYVSHFSTCPDASEHSRKKQ